MMFRAVLIILLVTFPLTGQDRSPLRHSYAIVIPGDSIVNTISDNFYGHNYWMWCPTWGNHIAGTEKLVADLSPAILRFGGIAADVGFPDDVTHSVLTGFYNYCREVGAQPWLQLQIACHTSTSERVKSATEMAVYFKKRGNPGYISIGNEPDIYPDNVAVNPSYRAEYLKNYTLDDYCTDFNIIAATIRRSAPTVKIAGLELSHKYEEWIPAFVAACGKNTDILSLHYYPNNAQQCEFDNVYNSVPKIHEFYADVRRLIDKNADGKIIPLVIGETNISWDGTPEKSIGDASPGTFNAALWFADFIGVSTTQKHLLSIMPWSISEGWTLGFISGKDPKPVYHIYRMFSRYGKKHLIYGKTLNPYVRIYAYKDDDGSVSLFAINWNRSKSWDTEIAFSGILRDTVINYSLPAHSLSCLLFSKDLMNRQIIEYTKKSADKPPVVRSIN
jgi:hypothetical protein